jgi:hypothetical protein
MRQHEDNGPRKIGVRQHWAGNKQRALEQPRLGAHGVTRLGDL